MECCIVGTGSRPQPRPEPEDAADQHPRRRRPEGRDAADVLRSLGIDAARIAVCVTAEETKAAWENGFFIAARISPSCSVFRSPSWSRRPVTRKPAPALPAGDRRRQACGAGFKEVDSVVGPGLSLRARQNNVIVTPVDGDQPSLLMGLITWAEVLGLDIVAAGKASEYDFVFDPENETGIERQNRRRSRLRRVDRADDYRSHRDRRPAPARSPRLCAARRA